MSRADGAAGMTADGDGTVDDVIEMAEDGNGCWTAVSVDLFQDAGVTETAADCVTETEADGHNCWAVLSKAG